MIKKMKETEKTEYEKRIKDIKTSKSQSLIQAQLQQQTKEQQLKKQYDIKLQQLKTENENELNMVKSSDK